MKLLLSRLDTTKKETLGRLIIFDDKLDVIFNCATIEPPWKMNKVNISCIPSGLYRVETRHSEKYGKHLMITDVAGRSYILTHWGNYYFDTHGCIIVGSKHRDINADGELDVIDSKKTFKKLMKIVESANNLTLRICYT